MVKVKTWSLNQKLLTVWMTYEQQERVVYSYLYVLLLFSVSSTESVTAKCAAAFGLSSPSKIPKNSFLI